ncbi:MAG: thermostable hemolysin [Rhodoferax sp.]|uniref:thermostable hemolysin n=1 Tax=Rhodoferax sp. TaxID=50421 RepID=UPI003C791380
MTFTHDFSKWSRPGQGLAMRRAEPQARRRLELVPLNDEAGQQAAEDFIRRRFSQAHRARVSHFMPRLFGLQSDDGSLYGAAGCRRADSGALFLERYLDVPIEQAILAHSGIQVERHQIVEVGNLAASGLGTARTLIVKLTRLLALQGFRWVTFTGTQEVLNSFHRLGLAPQSLGLADPARMGESLAEWGRYYDSAPQVVFGEILPAHRQLLEAPPATDAFAFIRAQRLQHHAA